MGTTNCYNTINCVAKQDGHFQTFLLTLWTICCWRVDTPCWDHNKPKPPCSTEQNNNTTINQDQRQQGKQESNGYNVETPGADGELCYHIEGKVSGTKKQTNPQKDTPVHQHTRVVWGRAPFLLTGFLHILEVPLCRFNIANLTMNNATTERNSTARVTLG